MIIWTVRIRLRRSRMWRILYRNSVTDMCVTTACVGCIYDRWKSVWKKWCAYDVTDATDCVQCRSFGKRSSNTVRHDILLCRHYNDGVCVSSGNNRSAVFIVVTRYFLWVVVAFYKSWCFLFCKYIFRVENVLGSLRLHPFSGSRRSTGGGAVESQYKSSVRTLCSDFTSSTKKNTRP